METKEAFFKTPGGHDARMFIREGTSDWNTVAACLENPMDGGRGTGDEYSIPSGLTGWALDVGAHIGSVTVGLLLDNPELKVVAIEGVPENVALIRRNLEANGVEDRAIVLHGIAWEGDGEATIEYGYSGSEVANVHTFIGSVTPWMARPPESTVSYATVPIISLADAVSITRGEGFAWTKTDCEGGEHYFFRGPAMRSLEYIVGEWHARDGTPEDFAAQLAPTHIVEWSDGDGQGGPFTAVRR